MTYDELVNSIDTNLSYWNELRFKKKYTTGNKVASVFVNNCKLILENKQTLEINNLAFVAGTLFQAFLDYGDIFKDIIPKKYKEKEIEKVWSSVWNCIQRLEFVLSHIKESIILEKYKKVLSLKDSINNRFLPEMYASPVIIFRRERCSLCNEDTRICTHISGRLYNGAICYSIPEDIKIKSIDIVFHPRDPRCRLWSWNVDNSDNKMKLTMPFLTFFRIDDWLVESHKS